MSFCQSFVHMLSVYNMLSVHRSYQEHPDIYQYQLIIVACQWEPMPEWGSDLLEAVNFDGGAQWTYR
jgi:hypothetical protein